MFFAKALAFAFIFIYVNALPDDFSDAINGFTNKFYKAVGDSKPGSNTVISGFSANTCLAFLSIGARGATQNELITALGFSSQANIESAFKPALVNVKNVKGITLNVANKAYVQDFPGLDLEPSFKQKAVDVFFSESEKINFAASNQAIATINQWITDKTNQKINNALKPGAVTSSTKAVLVNAVYFKGLWKTQFDPKNTRKADFNVNLNKKIQVDMMQMTNTFGFLYKEDWEANVVELPYKEMQASMVIVVPDKIDGLAEVEKKVIASNIKSDVFDQISKNEIELKMPKFKIETEIDLKTILPKLNINLIFDEKADLTGLLNTQQRLYVSTAIQKAYIEVNEEGTEAAAVTVIELSESVPQRVVCDRPFLFFVKLATGEILFSGRYTGIDTSNGDKNTINSGGVINEEIAKKICLSFPSHRRPSFCRKYFPIGSTRPILPISYEKSNLIYKP